MSAYTIYLDKEETFECEVSIKNASIKDSSARLIIESDDINLVFFGTVSKDTISVPIKSLKKYFTENDKATIKLEVIVENNLVTPWESELLFDSYNKVEIKEIKNVKSKPLIEIKVKEDKKQQQLEAKTKEIEQKVFTESKKPVKSLKEKLLESVNDQIKKIQVDGKLNKEEKKELIKKLLSNEL
jgi:superfamily II DNA or RNA helicase